VEKLAALVPPPRVNQVRYHGVLAPCAGLRDRLVPRTQAVTAAGVGCAAHARRGESRPAGERQRDGRSPPAPDRPPAAPAAGTSRPGPEGEERGPLPAVRPRRYSWPELMQRVFAVDVLECPRCRGRLRILAGIHPPGPTRAILEHLGLPARAPPPVPPAAGMSLGPRRRASSTPTRSVSRSIRGEGCRRCFRHRLSLALALSRY
jgi:hypothetical protein